MFEVGHRSKFGIFRLKDVYHADTISRNESGYDMVYYYHCKEKFGSCQERMTLLIDLTMDEEELLQSFSHSTRYAIRKAMKSNDLKIEIIENPDRETRRQFREFYERFKQVKEGWYPQDRFFDAHMKLKNIDLFRTVYRGEILGQFTCVPHGDTVLGAFGCTVRLFDGIDKKFARFIGEAHRMMDYRIMLHYKSKGYRIFDFGGLVENEVIDAYKLGFGGEKLMEYSFMYPLTARGRLFCWAKDKKMKRRLKPQHTAES
jgi:lipid II:glycine glycyltransferase (peptidoglycan interpeptide bridge formation enzyme)